MGFNCGIVGLPNVGKSTIFNALTAAGVDAANYPFCTIEPNTGIVAVNDQRLDNLAKIAKSAKLVPTTVEFVDIAGLVKGASEGEGLGNQFLGHIRAVDAVIHVVRCFEDGDVVHVDGQPNPQKDIEVIETELLLADLSVVEKRLDKVAKGARSGDKELKLELEALELCKKTLSEGVSLRNVKALFGGEFPVSLRPLGLITAKPMLYLANVDEERASMTPEEATSGLIGELVSYAKKQNTEVVIISGKVESEISSLDLSERESFLTELGLSSSGLDRLALSGYKLLDLITFFTVGPKEAHAWTCGKNSTAVDAAGVIHSDFAKGFIRAEVIGYRDYISHNGEQGAKDKGLLRLEGKAYQMRDGDVVHFRFNV
jgi:ribosome-binding ATPase